MTEEGTTIKDTTQEETQGTTPPQPDVTAGDGQPPESGEETQRTFSQAELDRIVRERIERERKKYAGHDDLKAQAAKWAEHEEAQKSELQKAQDAAALAATERDRALLEANERLLRAAFLAEAGKVAAVHPEDAYLLADLSEVGIAEGGAVTGVAEQVKALVEAGRLALAGKPKAPNLEGGAGSGERSQDKPVKLTQEEIEAARKMGVSLEEYQKYKLEK